MLSITSLFSPYELLGAYAVLLLGACFLLIAPLFVSFNNAALKSISILTLFITAVVFLSVGMPLHAGGFFHLYIHDELAFYASLIILASSILYIFLRKEPFLSGEFLALFLFMITCLLFMVASDNLVIIFIALEGSSLALYALIAHKRKATDAAIGYFNYGMIGSAFFAMASAVYYYESGTLFLGPVVANHPTYLLSSVMFLCVVLYKLSIAPFHMWLSKVYKDSEGAMAGFVSVVPKIAMMVVVYKLSALGPVFSYSALIIACIAMLFASFRSLQSTEAKQMLVYSSISHSAFALASITYGSTAPFIYYFATFAFINMALFAYLDGFKSSEYKHFNGLLKASPFSAMFVIIMLLDLAALPPFGIFFAKVVVINSMLSAKLYCPAIIMAISSIVMLFAYLRFISAVIKPCTGNVKVPYFSVANKIGFYLALIASIVAAFSADFIFERLL